MTTVHTTHLGYRTDDPMKRALVPLRDTDAIQDAQALDFQVIDYPLMIKNAYANPPWIAAHHVIQPAIERTPLGAFAVCDFSALQHPSGYQLTLGSARSYPVIIQRHAWRRCFRLLLEWYRAAACGEAVPGYHDACHLDDCVFEDSDEAVDLVGGWHDAGDLRKWNSTMAEVTYRLAEFLDEQGDEPSGTGVDSDLLYHQLTHGVRYLLKTEDPDRHLVWHSIASAGDNSDCRWTDNTPGTGDERRAVRDLLANTNSNYIQAMAAAARHLQSHDAQLANAARASAERVWSAAVDLVTADRGPEGLVAPALEMWRLTRDDAYREAATQGLAALLARQVTDGRFGQDLVRGYFLDGDIIGLNEEFKGRGARNLYRHMLRAEDLSWALLLWPDAPGAPAWRNGLELLMHGCIAPLLALSPYRMLPSCFYRHGDTSLGGRPLAGDLAFRYFPPQAEGSNYNLMRSAGAFALAARALDDPQWAVYGYKQLEWVTGFNPDEQSMLNGIGYSDTPMFSFYVGQLPGSIINGYTGTNDDEPLLPRRREMHPMNVEPWSIIGAAALRALAYLENQPLA